MDFIRDDSIQGFEWCNKSRRYVELQKCSPFCKKFPRCLCKLEKIQIHNFPQLWRVLKVFHFVRISSFSFQFKSLFILVFISRGTEKSYVYEKSKAKLCLQKHCLDFFWKQLNSIKMPLYNITTE